uniref:Uncharacterized protein MANES_09G110000 n=1 Tax=Rhizophora mucronata TaxID=61149 RepID=A0A2P2K1X2_RHIMU
MGDFAGKIDVERLVSYSDDLVAVLKDKKDVDKLTQCLEQFKVLKTSCDADSNEARSQLQGNLFLYLSRRRTFFSVSPTLVSISVSLLRGASVFSFNFSLYESIVCFIG